MDWNAATVWWLAAGALVAVELTTGSFYLLMLALGAAAGAVAAHLGWSTPTQVLVAVLLGGAATAALYARRARQPAPEPSQANRDVNIDIGRAVHVEQWAGDGSARVVYRGASWAVRFAGTGHPHPGEHVIVALDGNELRVAPKARTN